MRTLPNDEKYIIRHEFYGGLVHSRTDGEHFEVGEEVVIFTDALRECDGDIEAAINITSQLTNTPITESLISNAFEAGILAEVVDDGLVDSTPQGDEHLIMDSIVRIRAERDSARERNYLRAPVNLSIYPIMKCGLDCEFCYVSEEKWTEGAAGVEAWLQVMEEAKDMGVPFISFLGGDPAYYRDIDVLIRACDRLGIKGTITTNGTYFPERLKSALVETENITPVFSIQSMDGFHNEITRSSYSDTVRAMVELGSLGKKFNVNIVYTEQSWEQLVAILDWCQGQLVTKVTVGVFANINCAPLRVPSFSEYRELHECMTDYIKQKGYRFDFQTEGCQLYTAYPEITAKPESFYEDLTLGCDAGQGRAEIMHDGTLLGCALLNKHRWGGDNVFEKGFQRAWDESASLARLRTLKNSDAACNSGGCNFATFCNGGCPAQNELKYGEPNIGGDHRCQIRDGIIEKRPELGRRVGKKLIPLTIIT